MKVFVIGKQNFLHFDEHIFSGFKELNHTVEHFQVNNRPPIIQLSRAILKSFFGKKTGNRISNSLYINILRKRLLYFKPDMVFFSSAFFIPLEFYEVVKELPFKVKILAWDIDTGYHNPDNHRYKEFIDILFVHENAYIEQNINSFSNIEFLPLCSNIHLYKNKNEQRILKSYFCGAWTKERDEIFSNLIDYDIVFRGWDWDKLSKKSKSFDIQLGTVSIEQQIEDYNKYFSVINKHQIENTPVAALNLRTFEAPSCGALLINDYREGIENYFDLENEICVYRNMDELKSILEKLKKFPEEFDQIRQNGYRRVLSEHTYEHRIKKIINIFNQL